MTYLRPLVPHLACLVLVLAAAPFGPLALANATAQLALFVPVVLIPAWRTGRMSYVDIGWPMGLALTGALALALGEGEPTRVWMIGGIYLAVGLRMGLGAISLWRKGHLDEELPRYAYQRIRWERRGIENPRLIMQSEALSQGAANMSFLALPALMISSNGAGSIHPLEIVGLALWIGAFAMESVADAQKLGFLREMRAQGRRSVVCDVGLWRYTRHPNYFAEWMVWNALIVMAIPSWIALRDSVHVALWLALGLCALFVTRIMYTVLTQYSGAKPAEFYSVQKRPAYRDYQARTSMFFPARPRREPAAPK